MKKLLALILILFAFYAPISHPFENWVSTAHAATDIVNDGTLSTGLVSCWEMDETSGSRSDEVGGVTLPENGTIGNYSGGGIQGAAADLELANNEYLSAVDSATTSITGNMTISLWVNPDDDISAASVNQALASKAQSSTQWSWLFDVDRGGTPKGKLRFWYSSTGAFPGAGANRVISDTDAAAFTSSDIGNWVHIVASVIATSSDVVFYKNGSAMADVDAGSATSIYDGTAAFEVGNWSGGGYEFNGGVDVVALWSRALTASEVSSLYASGSGIPCVAAGGGGGGGASTRKPAIFF